MGRQGKKNLEFRFLKLFSWETNSDSDRETKFVSDLKLIISFYLFFVGCSAWSLFPCYLLIH